jgi:hypothetical protein
MKINLDEKFYVTDDGSGFALYESTGKFDDKGIKD